LTYAKLILVSATGSFDGGAGTSILMLGTTLAIFLTGSFFRALALGPFSTS